MLRGLGGDDVIRAALTGLPFGQTGVLLTVLAITFLLGFFLDWVEITLIILPLVAPVLFSMGVDPLWFAILFALCLQTSFLTPPFGYALFYFKGVAPEGYTMGHVYKGIMPFVLLQIIGLIILATFPGLITWLPSVFFGG